MDRPRDRERFQMIPPGNTSTVVNLAVGSNALSSLHLSSIVDFKRVDDYTSTQTAMVAILAGGAVCYFCVDCICSESCLIRNAAGEDAGRARMYRRDEVQMERLKRADNFCRLLFSSGWRVRTGTGRRFEKLKKNFNQEFKLGKVI
ncbi:unnamed protein product [Arctogadus glacialis]